MKVAVIGGGGRVGSCAAFAIQTLGVASEIQLLDANADMASGEALDMMHSSSVYGGNVYAGDYASAADSDIFVITAGLRRKPDESRLDLINRNVSLFKQILSSMKQGGFKKDAIVFVVSNPVDVLTYLACKELGLPSRQVIGLGTMLDTARFRSLISAELKVPAQQVSAMILGEHGDSMFPVWSSASLSGLSLKGLEGFNMNFQNKIFDRTKKSGAEVIAKKGGAGWAVGATIAQVVKAIILDTHEIMPISSLMTGAYGLKDVCISVPTVVGKFGALEHKVLELWPKELQELQASSKALKQTISLLGDKGV